MPALLSVVHVDKFTMTQILLYASHIGLRVGTGLMGLPTTNDFYSYGRRFMTLASLKWDNSTLVFDRVFVGDRMLERVCRLCANGSATACHSGAHHELDHQIVELAGPAVGASASDQPQYLSDYEYYCFICIGMEIIGATLSHRIIGG